MNRDWARHFTYAQRKTIFRRVTSMTDHSPTAGGVYRVRNTTSGDSYIGATANIYRRCCTHERLMRRGDHDNRFIRACVYRHGIDTFVFEVLELVEDKEARAVRERRLIRAHDPSLNINQRATSPQPLARGG